MSKQREYLVAVSASSINHIWIKAASEDAALDKAVDLWTNAETDDFVPKGGAVDSVTVLEDRGGALMSIERTYHVTFVEVIRHTGTVQARSEKAARTIVRNDWNEVGAEAFRQETLGMSELISVDEVHP